MSYPSAFFALMIHKSVTCAMFPNKPGIPLTKKIKYTCTFFGDGICQLSFFSHTSILRASSVLCVSPAQVSSFAPKFSLGARFQNLFLQPHPHPSNFLGISPPPLPPTDSSNRRCRNHNFNHIYILLESSQVIHQSLSWPRPDCLNGACETSSCLQIPTAGS